MHSVAKAFAYLFLDVGAHHRDGREGRASFFRQDSLQDNLRSFSFDFTYDFTADHDRKIIADNSQNDDEDFYCFAHDEGRISAGQR